MKLFSIVLILLLPLLGMVEALSRVRGNKEHAVTDQDGTALLLRQLAVNTCAKCINGNITDGSCLKDCFCRCGHKGEKACKGKEVRKGYSSCVRNCVCPPSGKGIKSHVSPKLKVCIQRCQSSKPYDLNGDGVESADDLILVFRSIDDPLGQISPGTLTADLNADGVVDLQDAVSLLVYLNATLGAKAIAPLTPTYFDDHVFNWDQAILSQRRRSLSTIDEIETSTTATLPFLINHRNLQQQCGQNSFGNYTKGTGPRPTIKWDNGFAYDPKVKATLADYAAWAKFTTLLRGAQALFQLRDGTKAYAHYRDASGTDLAADYEKAFNEDTYVSEDVTAELDAVEEAVKQLHDGSEASFQFYSTDSRFAESATENWQKAIGGHRIWSTGTVTYSTSPCQLQVDITVTMEDFYNFNKGDLDIATGLPDDENGRFEVLGWAKSFFSRGELKRTKTIALQCCKDEDCGNPTEFDCQCSLCVTQCPTNQRSGGQGFTSFTVELYKTKGTIDVFYDMYQIPDELNIYYEGARVFGTGGLVSGANNAAVTYGSATSTSTVVTVEVNAPETGTQWEVSVSCPP